jgi:hypothetical protein
MNRHINVVSIVIAILSLAICEITAMIGKGSLLDDDNTRQSNSTALNTTNTMPLSHGKKIIITWIETNRTYETNSPVINISNEDFWKAFGPLLK